MSILVYSKYVLMWEKFCESNRNPISIKWLIFSKGISFFNLSISSWSYRFKSICSIREKVGLDYSFLFLFGLFSKTIENVPHPSLFLDIDSFLSFFDSLSRSFFYYSNSESLYFSSSYFLLNSWLRSINF